MPITVDVEDVGMALHPDGPSWRAFGFETMRDVASWISLVGSAAAITAWTQPSPDLARFLADAATTPMDTTETIRWMTAFASTVLSPHETYLWRACTSSPEQARRLRDAGVDPTELWAVHRSMMTATHTRHRTLE